MGNSEIAMERKISVLYKELGPIEAIKFLQKLGISKGGSAKEIEIITEKFSRKEALDRLKRYRK